MRKFSVVTVLLTLVAMLAMPVGVFAQDGEQTIVDIAASDENFSTLVAAVTEAGLVEALSAEGPYTVFAPTNDAFEATLDFLGITAEDLLADEELLTQILLYHVVEGEVFAEQVVNLDSATTLQGSDILINANDEGVFLNDGIQVIATDIDASNGVIHVIDGVLIPDIAAEDEMMDMGTIVDIAASDENFSTLVAAVTEADLAETLAGEGPFTVFAPTNDAFDAAFEALGISAEDLLADTDTLTDILLYHVVEGKVMAADVTGLESATTVQGSDISISVTDDGVMLNDSVMVTTTDIEASNGVIHVIDGVLLPPAEDDMMEDEMMEMGTIVDIAAGSEDFSTLVAAVQAADLVDALSAEGPYTVFAPTNEAFAAALDALGITAEDLLADTDTLTSILLYHVVEGKVMAADVTGLDSATTLQGGDISISVTDAGVMLNDSVMVTATDIEASNGVIHVIDGVLLPPAE